MLFWLYFALPFLGVSLSADVAAILGLGLVHGAYSSEVVRGALGSVGSGQWEAASALGLSRVRTILLIILPQALLIMLPSLGNAMILLLKGTSLASIIGFIRRAALGDPLVPYPDRVDRGLKAVLAKHAWTEPQRQWLKKIAAQLKKEVLVDREALDQGAFQRDGGFQRLNKVFDGKVVDVIGDLQDEVWAPAQGAAPTPHR